METLLLSRAERAFVLGGCRNDCRMDGRQRNEFRSYTIVTGSGDVTTATASVDEANNDNGVVPTSSPPLILSNGSARLLSSCSGLHLLCSVKAQVVHPSQDRPSQGVVQLHVDTLTTVKSQKDRQDQDEIQSMLEHLLQDHLVDRKALCVCSGHYVWQLDIDLYILQASVGSLLDAASHVIRAALEQTLLPAVAGAPKVNNNSAATAAASSKRQQQQQQQQQQRDSGQGNREVDLLLVDGDIRSAKPPPGVDRAPIMVTVTVLKCAAPTATNANYNSNFNSNKKKSMMKMTLSSSMPEYVLILDATAQEEACAYAQVHVAISNSNNNSGNDSKDGMEIVALYQTGKGSLPFHLLAGITATALRAAASATASHRRHYCNSKTTQQLHQGNSHLLQEHFLIQS